MLNNIKLLLGLSGTDKDTLLNLLITHATKDFILFTGVETVSADFNSVIEEMVVFKYNRLGTEGLNSESYSGASYNYSSNYSDSIMATLNTIKKANLGKLRTL